jgi:hypothetical protein
VRIIQQLNQRRDECQQNCYDRQRFRVFVGGKRLHLSEFESAASMAGISSYAVTIPSFLRLFCWRRQTSFASSRGGGDQLVQAREFLGRALLHPGDLLLGLLLQVLDRACPVEMRRRKLPRQSLGPDRVARQSSQNLGFRDSRHLAVLKREKPDASND